MTYQYYRTKDDRFFKYGILFDTMLDFHYTRQWLTRSYGVGGDVVIEQEFDNQIKWGYHLEYHCYVIYLQDDAMLNWFKLKYGDATL